MKSRIVVLLTLVSAFACSNFSKPLPLYIHYSFIDNNGLSVTNKDSIVEYHSDMINLNVVKYANGKFGAVGGDERRSGYESHTTLICIVDSLVKKDEQNYEILFDNSKSVIDYLDKRGYKMVTERLESTSTFYSFKKKE